MVSAKISSSGLFLLAIIAISSFPGNYNLTCRRWYGRNVGQKKFMATTDHLHCLRTAVGV
ncbi:hypothetical protein C5167_027705 [Papaver somniferum]|nr:hypothetical protein C5167_027705 [Papaver somniferum]